MKYSVRRTKYSVLGTMALLISLTLGCQQKMAHQPRIDPLQGDAFFADGRGARPLEYGTVARGQDTDVRPDGEPGRAVAAFSGVGSGALGVLTAVTTARDPVSGYADKFPFAVTREHLERGRERYNIFCAPCHDRTGNGQGLIVLRGFTPPPNLITDNSRGLAYLGAKVSLRDVPPGYIVDVISRGYGAMADYSAQVPPADRWMIAAYVRALQFSQRAPLDALPPGDRDKLNKPTAEGHK